ncbi:MAG TPA: SRPBCC domain-containing protein [Gaiellaceae bacterium]
MEVTRELVLPAPPEEVWEALTDPERLEEWFANEVERDGDALVYRWGDGEVRRATIEESDEPRRLGFRWADPDGGEETLVTFELEEDDEGTRLTVTESPSSGWTAALELHALAFAHAA